MIYEVRLDRDFTIINEHELHIKIAIITTAACDENY